MLDRTDECIVVVFQTPGREKIAILALSDVEAHEYAFTLGLHDSLMVETTRDRSAYPDAYGPHGPFGYDSE